MKLSKLIMAVGALLPLLLFVLPMWSITLEAPQYPIPLGIEIYIDHLGEAEHGDIQNFDLMNHYVGMKELPTHMVEFDIFPYVIIGMSLIGLFFAFLARKKLYLLWFAMYSFLGAIGVYDFYLWLYDYGHDLDPKAAIKLLDSYQPPIFGTELILNFTVRSYPSIGSIFLGVGILFSILAFVLANKEEKE